MKTQIVLSIFAASAACACSGDADSEPLLVDVQDEQIVGPSWEEYRAGATASEDGGFVAERDLWFPNEAALRQHYEDLRLEEPADKLAVFKQISTGLEPTYKDGEALDIVYCVSNLFTNKATVVQDMANATGDWSRTANVRFRYDPGADGACRPTNTSVDFAVVPITTTGLAGCALSKLFWRQMSSGCASGPGSLELNYSELPFFPGMTARGLIRHELGHMLGFRHEHPWAPSGGGCPEKPDYSEFDLTARRLTDYDRLSVMHYARCGGIPNVDSTISYLDRMGAIAVYDIPASWHVPIASGIVN